MALVIPTVCDAVDEERKGPFDAGTGLRMEADLQGEPPIQWNRCVGGELERGAVPVARALQVHLTVSLHA